MGLRNHIILGVVALFFSGCQFFGFGGQPETVYLTNLIENDAKVWKPAELEAYAGKVVFEVENTLEEPHGFVIKGVKEPIVVGPQKTVKVTANLKPGTYSLECHMHPAHVPSSITIVRKSKALAKDSESSVP